MNDVDVEVLQKLHHDHRDPDPAHIAKLPKPTKRDNQKGRCNECGGWHGLPAVHLDYMGHAEVTDVLLEADPTWTWEPFAVNAETGLPRIYEADGDLVLWINLTIAGITRPGVGTAAKSKAGDALKELIGDAIRNAAMRFGVALTLWSKAEGVERAAETAATAPVEGITSTVLGDRIREALTRFNVEDPEGDHGKAIWRKATPKAAEDGLIYPAEADRVLSVAEGYIASLGDVEPTGEEPF